MWFKNLKVFLIKPDANFVVDGVELNACLEAKTFTPLGDLQESTFGFIKPHNGSLFAEFVGNAWVITAMVQEKIMPPAVINEYLSIKLDEIEEREGRRPGKKEREQLKEDIRFSLLPRAFHKTTRVSAFIDPERGLLVVNSASDKVADNFTAHLRVALGSLPILPAVGFCHTELTSLYIDAGFLPTDCEIEDDLSLRLPTDRTVKANFKNLAKDSEEIRTSINNGMRAEKIGMSYADLVSFVLTEGLDFKRLKYSSQLVEQASDDEDPRTDTILMLDTLGRLFDAFGINASKAAAE